VSPEETIASIRAAAETPRPEDVLQAAQAAFWDEAMKHWWLAHSEEFQAFMADVARIVLKVDGAVGLLALYVTTARIEHSTRGSPANKEIQSALRRLADDIADEIGQRPS
jgi:hypothetical protein